MKEYSKKTEPILELLSSKSITAENVSVRIVEEVKVFADKTEDSDISQYSEDNGYKSFKGFTVNSSFDEVVVTLEVSQ